MFAFTQIGLPRVTGLLLLSLCGCASVTPAPVAPGTIEVPAVWSAAGVAPTRDQAPLAQWWSHFNDPLLTRLVAQALQSGNSVNSAQAALRQARALRDVAAAALWPSLNASASAGQSKTGRHSAVNALTAGLDASWELDIFGVNRSALDASEASARASVASLGDVQVSMAAEVALDYVALRSAQTRLAIASDNLVSQRETLQITRWRLQAGLVSSLEAEQARTAAEQTSALIPALQTSIDQSCHALAVLTGQAPEALLSLLRPAGPIPHADDSLALSLPAQTLRQRPDVRAAEHQVTAAQARVSQADAARLPNFALSGSLGLNAATLGALGGSGAVVSSVLAGVSLPVFDGGALRAQVRVQQAALDQAQLAYEAAVLTALTDVEDALAALRGDRLRLLSLQQAAEAAGNAMLMARQRYGSGLVDFQTVLDTQRAQLTTQDSVATASADVSADHVRLYKALGGGWRPDSENLMPISPAIADRTTRP